MQMCTKQRGHFAARCSRACPALFRLHPLFIPPFPLASGVLRHPAGLLPGAHNTQTHRNIHTHHVLRRKLTGGFRVAQPRRPPPPVSQHATIGRSFCPSVPRHYFARGAGKRGKSCLRCMNKILFSPHATNAFPAPHRRALGRSGMLWKDSGNRDLNRTGWYVTKQNTKVIIII